MYFTTKLTKQFFIQPDTPKHGPPFLGADPPGIVKNKSFTFTAHAPQPIL